MYTLFILFFGSLLGIAVMVGRRVAATPHGQTMEEDYEHPFVPDMDKLKRVALHSSKKYGKLGLIITLRAYLKSLNFLKNKYEVSKDKIKSINLKNGANGEMTEKVEVSKFLKTMSAYKNKIRAIKHQIKEEENL